MTAFWRAFSSLKFIDLSMAVENLLTVYIIYESAPFIEVV